MKPQEMTAQYVTVAIALRIALFDYFDDVKRVQAVRPIESNEGLEARRLTIVLLAAALCESCVNVAMSVRLGTNEFKKADWTPTVQKWASEIAHVNPAFPFGEKEPLRLGLEFLFTCRNSITHAKPQVWAEEKQVIHAGNHTPWDSLTHESVLPLAEIPILLAKALGTSNNPFVLMIGSNIAHELFLNQFKTGQKYVGLLAPIDDDEPST